MAKTGQLTHPLSYEEQVRHLQRQVRQLQRQMRNLQNQVAQYPRGVRQNLVDMDDSDVE